MGERRSGSTCGFEFGKTCDRMTREIVGFSATKVVGIYFPVLACGFMKVQKEILPKLCLVTVAGDIAVFGVL